MVVKVIYSSGGLQKGLWLYSESFKSITGGDVVVVNRGGGSVDLKVG